MRALVQRVQKAKVTINRAEQRSIGQGLVVFLGITHTDSLTDVEYLVDKIGGLRIFRDNQNKMNRSLRDVGGDLLLVSQFTLYGDVRKGRRPSFVDAASLDIAIPLYESMIERFIALPEINTKTGEFGADMLVEIANDGPVTFMIESK